MGRMVASMKGNPMLMIMMKISNKRQSNRCGGGKTKTMITTITTTTGRAGIRVYWGCLIILSGDDWNDTTTTII